MTGDLTGRSLSATMTPGAVAGRIPLTGSVDDPPSTVDGLDERVAAKRDDLMDQHHPTSGSALTSVGPINGTTLFFKRL